MSLASSKARRFATGFKALCVGLELRKDDSTVGSGTFDTDFKNAPANITRIDLQPFTLASPGAIASGRAVAVSVTVADANLGDVVIINPPASLEAGLTVGTAYVSAANTISFSITNTTAGSITPALQTLTYSFLLFRSAA